MQKGITFEADGNIYQLRFSVNNLVKVEELLGMPISKIGANSGFKELRVLVFCSILPSQSLSDCGDIMEAVIEEQGVDKLNSIIQKALELSLSGGSAIPPEVIEGKKKI